MKLATFCLSLCVALALARTATADLRDAMPFDQPVMLWIVAHSPSVQKELGIEQEQLPELEALVKRIAEPGGASARQQLSTLLSPERMQRLQEIAWQARPDKALRSRQVARQLSLSDEQRAEIKNIWGDAQERLLDDMRRMRFASPSARNNFIRRRMDAASMEMRKVLTAKQEEGFQKLLGKPFPFEDSSPTESTEGAPRRG